MKLPASSSLIFTVLFTFAAAAHAGMALDPRRQCARIRALHLRRQFPEHRILLRPMGIVFLSNGQVMVSDYPGNVRVLPNDADGQHANGVAPGQSYGNQNGVGLANLSGSFYMAEQVAGKVIQLNSDGTFNSDIVNIGTAVGIVADGVHNQLYVSSIDLGIFRVDPVAKPLRPSLPAILTAFRSTPWPRWVYGVRDANTIGAFVSAMVWRYSTPA